MPKKITTLRFGDRNSKDMVRYLTESGTHTLKELDGQPLRNFREWAGKREIPGTEITLVYVGRPSTFGQFMKLYYVDDGEATLFFEGLQTGLDTEPAFGFKRRERKRRRQREREQERLQQRWNHKSTVF